MLTVLNANFSRDEIIGALKQMPLPKLALFYQKMQNIMGDDVVNTALDILNNGVDPSAINSTFLCLILKIKKPRHTQDFRPISFCNLIFKIVTKIIANRLKLILPLIVGQFQITFVPDQLITNNGLVAFDILHYMKKKIAGQKGYVGMKLDIANAYDWVEWGFLKEVLKSMAFLNNLCQQLG